MKYKIDKVNANEVYSDTSEEKEKQEHAYLLQDRLWKVFVLNLSLLVLNVFLLFLSQTGPNTRLHRAGRLLLQNALSLSL